MSDETATRLLSQMVKQFKTKHNRPPLKICITPTALLALAVKKGAMPQCEGVPVLVKNFTPADATGKHAEAWNLGVFLQVNGTQGNLACCDLKQSGPIRVPVAPRKPRLL